MRVSCPFLYFCEPKKSPTYAQLTNYHIILKHFIKNFTLKIGDYDNPTSGTTITPTVSQQNENVYTFDCSFYKKNYFVLANGANAGYLSSIAITYLVGNPDSYTNYCTTVATDLEDNAITGINDSYTLDLANKNTETLDLSGATATSGATVQFQVTSTEMDGYYTLDDGVLTVWGNGVFTVRAYVNGDETYKPAEKTVTVTVIDDPDITTYAGETDDTAFGTNYVVEEDLIYGGPITLQSGNTTIATVSGLVITPVAVGSATITINTAATNIWHARSATFTLNITAPEGSDTAPSPYAVKETFDGFVEDSNNQPTQGGNPNSEEEDLFPFSKTAGSSAFQADNCDESDWVVIKGGAGYQCARFGTSDDAGSAKTRSIAVTNGKPYTLSFKAAPWAEDNTTMNVTATGATVSGISTDVMENYDLCG